LEDLKIAKPLIEINVPNLNLSEVKNTTYEDEEGNIYLQLPWIGEYIAALYRFAVIIASIFAVVMIINKGFSIVMSGGGEEKVAAYKRIGQILIGLSLVWGSYTLLYYINPSLVQFKVLSVQFIQRQDLPPEDLQPSTGSSDDNAPELSGDNNWVAIGNIPKVIAQSGQIARPDVVEALRQAAKNFPGNVNLKSAGRSAAGQYAVMVKNCGCISVNTLPQNIPTGQWSEYCTDLKPGGNGCDAGYTGLGRKDGQFTAPNISHTGGNALDLFAEGRGFVSCTGQDEKVQKSAGVNNSKKCKGTNCCVPEKQQKLIKAMLDAGFCVALKSASGLRESWHFELTGNSAINSSFCTKDLNDPNLQRLKFLQ
ncbi:MAG: pilin, partial [Patescibacteria group bacterium]